MTVYSVLPGQSLSDIALIKYGDISGVAFLLNDNPDLKGPTDRLYPGQELNIRDVPISLRTKEYLEDYPVIATISTEDQPEGIGFWRLDEYEVQ